MPPGRNAYGMFKVTGGQITDGSGNVIITPDNNFCSLVCYVLTLMKNLVILWRLYVPLATDLAGPTTAPPVSRLKHFVTLHVMPGANILHKKSYHPPSQLAQNMDNIFPP